MAKSIIMVLSVVLVLVGLLGFFNDPVLGIFEVDAVHNIVHILTGIIGIAMASKGEAGARTFGKVFGVVYALVTIVGFVQGDSVLGLLEINAADNYLHLVLTLVFLYVGFMGNKSSTMSGSGM